MLGTIFYLSMVAMAVAAFFDSRAWRILNVLGLVAIGAAVWFTFLQAIVIRRFCVYCLLLHAAGVSAGTIVLVQLRPWNYAGFAFDLLAATGSMAFLIVGQIVLKPPMYRVTASSPIVTSSASGPSPTPLPPVKKERTITGRKVSLLADRIEFNLDDWPILGPPTAKHVIAWLFDHTCQECHHEHRLLREMIDRFNGDLAVIAVAVPMNAACNPSVKTTEVAHIQACTFARLGWAVWLADAERYDAWDRFMAEDTERQPLGLAIEKARSLVGALAGKFDDPDPAIDPKLASGIAVFATAQAVTIPALLFPNGMLRGRVPSAAELHKIISENLK